MSRVATSRGWLAVLVGTAALVAVGADQVQRQHDGVLREMRPAGCPGAGLSDLTSRPWDRTSAIEVATVVETWHAIDALGDPPVERVAPCAVRRVAPVAGAVAGTDPAGAVGAGGGLSERFSSAREVYQAGLRWRQWVVVPTLTAAALAAAWVLRRRAPLRLTAGLAALGGMAFWVETALATRRIDTAWDLAAERGAVDATRIDMTAVHLVSTVRWAALGALAGLLVASAFRPVVAAAGRSVAASRGRRSTLVVAVGYVAAIALVPQAADAVRRWDLEQLVVTIALTAALSCALAASALGPEPHDGPLPAPAASWRRRLVELAPLGAGAAALAGLGVVTDRPGLYVPASVLGVVAVLSLPAPTPDPRPSRGHVAEPSARRALLAAAGAACPAALGFTMLRVGSADLILLRDDTAMGRVVAGTGFVLLAGAPIVAAGLLGLVRSLEAALAVLPGRRVDGRAGATGGPRAAPVVAGVAVVAVGAALAVPTLALADPNRVVAWGAALGSIGVLTVFLLDVVAVLVGARALGTWLATRPGTAAWAVPPVLRQFGLSRPPLVGLVVVWALGAQLIGPGEYHAVRTIPSGGSPFQASPSVTVDDLAARWASRQAVDPGAALPAVVVSASGGGLRAAYWTAAVLDCLIDGETVGDDPCAGRASPDAVARRRSRLLLMSGVSGGALGLVSYVAAVDGWERDEVEVLRPRWYDTRLGGDAQAPVLARLLFGDLPELLLRHGSGVDRATILERAWEAQWPGGELAEGFVAGQHAGEPLLVLAGLEARSGCRFSTSVLVGNGARRAGECATPAGGDAGPLHATEDLVDHLCADRDVRRSTAALLSARFPIISPSGRVTTGRCHGPVPTAAHVIDGGYREAVGASPVAELMPALERSLTAHPDLEGACVVPLAVQLDSTEDVPVPPGADPPNETVLPVLAVNRARAGNEAAARAAVAELFTGPVTTAGRVGDVTVADPSAAAGAEPTRSFTIAPGPRPGAAVPLGWSLADETRADLQDQLRARRVTIEHVRALLDGSTDHLTCEPATGSTTDSTTGATTGIAPTRGD